MYLNVDVGKQLEILTKNTDTALFSTKEQGCYLCSGPPCN